MARGSVRSFVAAVAAAAVAGCGPVDDYVSLGTVELEHEVGDAQRVLISNVLGTIRVVPGASERVTVKAEFRAPESRRDELAPVVEDALRVEMEERTKSGWGFDGQVLVIESVDSESPRFVGLKIDLEIEAPAQLSWSVHGSAGEIHVKAAGNDVDLDSELATIELTGSAGTVRIASRMATVSADLESLAGGSLEAREDDLSLVVRRSGPTEELTLLSLSGDVSIELPATASAGVELSTGLGELEVVGAPAIATQPRPKGARAAGALGAGGAPLRATSESGDVRLLVRE